MNTSNIAWRSTFWLVCLRGLFAAETHAEVFYNPPYQGSLDRVGLLRPVDSAVEIKKLADEADMIFIGIVDHPRIVSQDIDHIPERYEATGRLLEANVRVYDPVRFKQSHYGYIEHLKLQYESTSLEFGDHFLFFVKMETDDEDKRFYRVTHKASVSPASRNKTWLFGSREVKTDLMRRVFRNWAYGVSDNDLATEFAEIVASNPDQVRLVPFLRIDAARPTWQQELEDSFFLNQDNVQRFSVIAHDILLRGSDDEIRALLKVSSRQLQEDGKPTSIDVWQRYQEYHVHRLLQHYADERLVKLLIEHADADPFARVSAANALARMKGTEAAPIIRRWQEDERMAKIKYRDNFGRWFPSEYSAHKLLSEALELAEGKTEEKTLEEIEASQRQVRAQQIQDQLARLNSDTEEQRSNAASSLRGGGKEAYDAMQIVARGPDDDLATKVKQIMRQMDFAKLVNWFKYHDVDPQVQDEQIVGITLRLNSHLSKADMQRMIEAIQQLPQLKHMYLVVSENWDAPLVHLAEMPQLESLRIEGPGVTDESLSSLTKLTTLQKLDLSRTLITDEGLKPLAELTHLKHLDLHGTNISDNGLKHLSQLKALEFLHLANLEITGSGLIHLDGLPALKDLKLHHGKVADLRGLKNLPALENLELYYSPITDEGLQNIDQLTSLKKLRLVSPWVTDASLPKMGKLKHLEELSLRTGNITDAGLKSLEYLTNLRNLNLTETQITDAGLASVSNLKKLESLSLHVTAVSDAGLEHLRGLKALNYLGINKTEVTPSGRAKFQQWIPECRFHY